jgi:hypothetical protein
MSNDAGDRHSFKQGKPRIRREFQYRATVMTANVCEIMPPVTTGSQ